MNELLFFLLRQSLNMKNEIENQKCFHSIVHDKHREKKVVTFAMQKFYLDTRLLSVSGNTKEGLKIWGDK